MNGEDSVARRMNPRKHPFWQMFLLTENGKPKSGLLLYTFCLSVVFLGFYVLAFDVVIDTLNRPLSALPAVWGNLLQSLTVGGAGALLSLLLHTLLKDKRLVFGAHLWLAALAAAATLALMLFLREEAGAIGAMLVFLLWFVWIPVAVGLGVGYLLFRRDYVPRSRRRRTRLRHGGSTPTAGEATTQN